MYHDLTESLKLLEELKLQAAKAKTEQIVAEAIADERLEELTNLQEKYEHLYSLNRQLESEVSE